MNSIDAREYLLQQQQLYDNLVKGNMKYYTSEYIENYKKHFVSEYIILRHHFPNVDFEYKGRIKSILSMKEKVQKKLNEGKTGRIYDLYGNKIIIYSVDGCDDEKSLESAAYEISNFISCYHSDLDILEDKKKDYISSPKSTGYQAIHIIRCHNNIQPLSSFFSETQIRTFRMEENQKYGTYSHAMSYKPNIQITPERCPTFLEIGGSKEKGFKTYVLSPKQSLEKYQEYFNTAQSGQLIK